jgi:hypothetical protein
MYPLDDDNLDRLSREAAEHFEVETGASGWDHLEQRLNKEMPQEKKRRRFLFWLFLITATTGGALTGILKYQPVTPLAKYVTSGVTPVDKTTPLPDNQTGNTRTTNTNQPETVSENNETRPTTAAPATGKLPVGNNQQPIAATGNTEPGIGTSKPAIKQPASTATASVPSQQLTKPVGKTTTVKGSKQVRVRIQKAPATLNYATIAPASVNNGSHKPTKQTSGKRRSKITSDQNSQRVPTVSDNNTTTFEPENGITNVDPATIGKPVDANNEVATTQPTTATQADSVKNKPAETPAVDSTKTMTKQKKKDDKIQQPLEFGVMAGPDMSAVAFGPLYKPGYNFGLQVGYRFSNRWSVNAGVIYTKKFYKTDSSHFEYKGNPWPPNRTVSRVEGNCSMWEIPVNVRYDFSYNDKRRWFASTGLSTYLMDKQDYDLYYRWNGSTTYETPWGSDSNSTYLFSILNLSAGMERSLGKRFSLQAEPYLKIPLKDLGMGNMRMNSYGILFTLKYKPFLNSKRSDKK